MTEGLLYADHFWGDKHHGFQVLQENMKRSEETCNEVTQFVKDRLTVEDEYVKAINRSVNKVTSFINNGSSIEQIWHLTKNTMELLSEIHLMLVKNLQDLSKEMQKYKDDVGKTRKEMKQPSVADAVNLMQTTTTCLQKAKETYYHRCNELEKARKEYSANNKEISKLESKVARAREEYQTYVDKYETVREDFETKMSESCKRFQTFDRSLYASIQQYIFLYATHSTEMSQASMQVTEQFRESIQHLNADEFVRKFLKSKSTGIDKPPHVIFEEPENSPTLNSKEINDIISANSMPSSCSSSGIQETMTTTPTANTVDLLMMDTIGEGCIENHSSGTGADEKISFDEGIVPEKKTSFSNGPAAKKLSMFMNKRKKTISSSSIDDVPAAAESFSASGLFNKFSREKRRSKKDSEGGGSGLRASVCMDDGQSTASSSKSDDKVLNGNTNPLDMPIDRPSVDEEGYVIREDVGDKEDTNWSSCSSDEDDENEMQQSKIRALTIRPADRPVHMNASVDELRDAIGSITLTRSTTFDRDPWTIGGTRAPPRFSQSMNVSSLRQPLRSHHTADGRFRTNFSESEDSNVPPAFSVSMNAGMGIARARPRSNTPTTSQLMSRKESTSSFCDPWSSTFNLAPSESNHSLGESSFNLSQSTGNLMQATISEQRIPIAMAVNEYSHVWFKKADLTQCVQRTFGTVMISFASSSIALLTSVQYEIEPLAFKLTNTDCIKAVLPNKQLIDESQSRKDADGIYTFYFNKANLASWLLAQQKLKPEAGFINAEVARYELDSTAPSNSQPPLFLTAYWKFENEHTDIRVDYRLNTESSIKVPLLNVSFTTTLTGNIENCTCDPDAKWNSENSNLSWSILEISRNGEVGGSLKARAHLKTSDEVNFETLNRKPAQVYAQFQCHETSLSGVDVSLVQSDIYHLSMVRKKVLAGKYFCDPELRT
ncbi:unnamed protein product [Caenorhabditis angaria]|uniref:F-BAR domain only protein 2 n=1 Tax=Caenorhabditis angaria TaxID=860376 RepID=A0A9P1MX19_9PELO|nr:unnamed protein product [Caenorhabditis angaria]